MSLEPKMKKMGRVALRHEGANWNAYYALPDTMNGAIPLGSIKMAFVRDNEERKAAFLNLMRECIADMLEQETGHRPTFPDGPQPAPEIERAGHG
jgi:hypothetical protein